MIGITRSGGGWNWAVWAVLAPLFFLAAEAASAANGSPEPLLDARAYWRFYILSGQDRISEQALRNRDPEVIGDGLFKRIENQTKQRVKGKDWAAVDWMTEARFMVPRTQAGGWSGGKDDGPVQFEMDFDNRPPPDGWMQPEFDDGAWPRQRLPFLMGPAPELVYEFAQPQTFGWQRACFRTRFHVDDPAAVKDITLHLAYRGGARVFVNGNELARGNLPAGALAEGTWAEDYPLEAYLAMADEVAEKVKGKLSERVIGEMRGAFLDGADPKKPVEYRGAGNGGRGGAVNRKGWERLNTLRDRVLTPEPLPIPPSLLRKGSNVLAIETRASRLHPVVTLGNGERIWRHTGVMAVELRSASPAVRANARRPAGVQLWVEDASRRLISSEFLETDGKGEQVRLVGGRNGTYAAQVVVGTDRELRGLKGTPGSLRAKDGGEIPATALSIRYLVPHGMEELIALGIGRNLSGPRGYDLIEPVDLAFMRHAAYEGDPAAAPQSERLQEAAKLSFFDHIAATPPASVPAGTCQPLWISCRVPAQSPAGTYKGEVTVEAEGLAPVAVPVELEVVDWRVPDPRDFTVYMAYEQSPYGVAKQYGVELWSDKHFELMEASFRLLARSGNRWLYIPVILNTEFGNRDFTRGKEKIDFRDPPMIRWLKKKDGALAFDYGVLDRYLDLACTYWGKPRGICFVIMQVGSGRANMGVAQVRLRDEATGKDEELNLVSANPEYERYWSAFGRDVYAHMKSRGLADAMYWGNPWDDINDMRLLEVLAKHVPEVGWATGGHASWLGRGPYFQFSSAIHVIQGVDKKGWKQSPPLLCNPRESGGLITAQGVSLPFSYRLAINRALVSGCNGVGRWGADYWKGAFGIYTSGYFPPGIGCVQILWPGEAGAESSQRYEAALEGIEETEARIFMEQAVDRGLLDEALAKRVQQTLWEHTRATLFISTSIDVQQAVESVADWQGDSRRIYRLAAEVAGQVQFCAKENPVRVEAPARGKLNVPVLLRNWSPKARTLKVASEAPWLTPEKTELRLPPDHEGPLTLNVTLDTAALEAGKEAKGSLNVTDAASGLVRKIAVEAQVGTIFELAVGKCYDFLGAPGHAASFRPKQIEDQVVFNVTAGGEEAREFALCNFTGSELPWKIESSAPWLKAEPSTGTLKPLERAFPRLVARPTDPKTLQLEAELTVTETRGGLVQKIPCTVHIVPPYQAPALPQGAPVPASSLKNAEVIMGHKSTSYGYGTSDPRRRDYGPVFEEGTLYGGMPLETTYKLEGSGFRAFSAKVQLDPSFEKKLELDLHRRRVNFELYVDGALKAQSGLVKSGDAPRLLAVEGLEAAKELRLVVRFDTPCEENLVEQNKLKVYWQEPTFYKAK